MGRIRGAATAALLLVCHAGCDADKPPERSPSPEQRLAKIVGSLGKGFTGRIEGHYLVAGNLEPARFDRAVQENLLDVSERLHQQLFTRRLDEPYVICLFADKVSYLEASRRLWGKDNAPHFGFHLPHQRVIVVNTPTGPGALVHELVHALARNDFPEMPPWLNEGLATLYECYRLEEDRIEGVANWRYPRLLRACKDGTLVPLDRLLALSSDDFRGTDKKLHYAESRYLCFYLQERALLEKVYARFREAQGRDPARMIEEATGMRLTELDRAWREWILRME